jgi:hypothetical protein
MRFALLAVVCACSSPAPPPSHPEPPAPPLDADAMIRAFPSSTELVISADMQRIAKSAVLREVWRLIQAQPTLEVAEITAGFCVRSLGAASRILIGASFEHADLWAWGIGLTRPAMEACREEPEHRGELHAAQASEHDDGELFVVKSRKVAIHYLWFDPDVLVGELQPSKEPARTAAQLRAFGKRARAKEPGVLDDARLRDLYDRVDRKAMVWAIGYGPATTREQVVAFAGSLDISGRVDGKLRIIAGSELAAKEERDAAQQLFDQWTTGGFIEKGTVGGTGSEVMLAIALAPKNVDAVMTLLRQLFGRASRLPFTP